MRTTSGSKWLVLVTLLLVVPDAGAQEYWSQIRHSALLPDARILLRAENPVGPGISNYVLYRTGSGVMEQVMTPVLDGPSTVEAAPPGPVTATSYYGFRLLQGDSLDLLPVRLPEGAEPMPADLSVVASDPVGDALFGFTNLDLVECRISLSDSRLYAVLRNAGGGFPVSSGLTFFGYLMGIVDPDLPDPDIVFGMMYTYNQPGVISPGLYKITGTGFDDLEKIGDVSVTQFPGENALLLSCLLGDLLSDPDFASWYDPEEPRISVAAFSQKITLLGGAQEADRTPGGTCHLREIAIDPEINQLPQLASFEVVGYGSGAYARVIYSDPNGHCPAQAKIDFDESEFFDLRPETLDYGGSVVYVSEPGVGPLADGDWGIAFVRFSDDLVNVVEASILKAAGVPDSVAKRGWPAEVQVFPNPFRERVRFHLQQPAPGPARAWITDAAGRTVWARPRGAAAASEVFVWDGRDGSGREVSAGRYYWQIESSGITRSGSLAVIR